MTTRERRALAALAVSQDQATAGRLAGCSDRSLRRHAVAAQTKLGAKSLAHALALAVLDGHLTRRHLADPKIIGTRKDPR